MRTLPIRTAASIGLIGLCAGTLITAYARADARNGAAVETADELLGSQLPAVTLQSVDGSAVPLAGRLSHGVNLVIVLGTKDCFSCSSYQLELRILKSKLPGVSPILIGSGADDQLFKDYFRQDHLESVGLIDRGRVFLTALRVGHEPLVLLADSTGRILFVDNRSSSAAAQFPLGRLLPLLGGALQPVPTTSKSGESH
jgi:hypothetical protein